MRAFLISGEAEKKYGVESSLKMWMDEGERVGGKEGSWRG